MSKFIDNKLELDFDSDSEKLKFFTFSNAFSLYLVQRPFPVQRLYPGGNFYMPSSGFEPVI